MLKISVLILTVMLIYGGAYSVISIIRPELVVEGAVEGATSKTLTDAENDGYLKAFLILSRDSGLFGLATITCGFFILFSGFRKGRKWAWFAFLIAGAIGWLGAMVLSISIGDELNIIIRALGTTISALGLFVPLSRFFGKTEKPKEAEA